MNCTLIVSATPLIYLPTTNHCSNNGSLKAKTMTKHRFQTKTSEIYPFLYKFVLDFFFKLLSIQNLEKVNIFARMNNLYYNPMYLLKIVCHRNYRIFKTFIILRPAIYRNLLEKIVGKKNPWTRITGEWEEGEGAKGNQRRIYRYARWKVSSWRKVGPALKGGRDQGFSSAPLLRRKGYGFVPRTRARTHRENERAGERRTDTPADQPNANMHICD